jgi:hypothetical protein
MSKVFSVVFLSILLMLSSGIACAAFGDKVAANDPDVGSYLYALPVGGPLFIYFNADSSILPAYNTVDPVYLNAIPIADRMTPFSTVLPGHQVVFGNPDFGLPWTGLPGSAIVYLPLYNGAPYNIGDPIYIKTNPLPTITTNDVRLTPIATPLGTLPAGSKVMDFHPDHGKTWTAIPGAWTLRFADSTPYDGVYSIGDKIYLHMTPAPFVTPGDLRLSA